VEGFFSDVEWRSETLPNCFAARFHVPAGNRVSIHAVHLRTAAQSITVLRIKKVNHARENRITAMSPSIQIRSYHPTDLEHLYQICLQTMDYGRDATPLYADGRLPGLFYAAPYVTCDPSLCLVACLDQKPCGYILGTNDSRAFEAWCEANWFPTLRTRYPVPPMEDSIADAKLIRLIHRGYRLEADLESYPGHLHIDLLPGIQRQGVGTKLITSGFKIHVETVAALYERRLPRIHMSRRSQTATTTNFETTSKDFAVLLSERNCPAFHLGVNIANPDACKFYESIGLRLIRQVANVRTYGLVLHGEGRWQRTS
jgi:GNAT superfamily N-acetyltransferase